MEEELTPPFSILGTKRNMNSYFETKEVIHSTRAAMTARRGATGAKTRPTVLKNNYMA
jgi:hypothetical protein